MNLWEKIKNFFVPHKNRDNISEHAKNIFSENSQEKVLLEKIKETELKIQAEISIGNKEVLSEESKIRKTFEDANSNVEEVFDFTNGEETITKADEETENVSNKLGDNELVIKNSLTLEISNTHLKDVTKKNFDIDNLKKPLTPLPNHNEDVNFKKFKEDYQYYLVKGTEYEKIRAIQSIKKAVREKDSKHEEWLDILLYVYHLSNKKIQKYILDTVNFFSLNIEETKRVNELRLPEEIAKDTSITDFKLEKPRIMLSRSIEDKVEEPVLIEAIIEKKKPDFKGSKKIRKEASPNLKENKVINRNQFGFQTHSPQRTGEIKLAEKERIKEECKKRGITSIFHFTNARNVKKILQYGILSLDELKELNIIFEANDNERLDGMKNSTCWSISFPNNKYFYRVRERHPECFYFETNAASSAVKTQSANNRKGYTAFSNMFVRKSPEDEMLSPKYPTDVQAEVLITKNIEPNRIKAIHTQDVKVFEYYHNLYPHLVKNTPSLFRVR